MLQSIEPQATFRGLICSLIQVLGRETVAKVAGASEGEVSQWVDGAREPQQIQRERLSLLEDALLKLTCHGNPDDLKKWLFGYKDKDPNHQTKNYWRLQFFIERREEEIEEEIQKYKDGLT